MPWFISWHTGVHQRGLHLSCFSLFSSLQGHAAPVLYAAWHVAGHPGVTHEDLLQLRKLGHKLEGHPTPVRLLQFVCCAIYPLLVSVGDAHVYLNILLLGAWVCSLCACIISYTAFGLRWCCYWLFGSRTECGCRHGLHWQALWQVWVRNTSTNVFCITHTSV